MRRVALFLAVLYLMAVPAAAQGTVMPYPVIQFVDSNGTPLSGGLLYTCVQGGSCPGSTQTTYSDAVLMTANANPVVLDTAGRAHVFLSNTTYKFVLQTSAGVTVWTQDNVTALAGVSLATITGTTITLKAPTVLTVSANAVTPTQNIHGLDTSGGAQNLNTINTNNVSAGFVLYLYGNNPGTNTVTITALGNIVLGAQNFILNTTGSWITLVLKGSTWYEIGRSATFAPGFANDFRVTLTTATCVTSSDVTAAVTLYLTPCTGNRITLFDTSGNIETCTTPEVSIAVPATTSTMYDVFAYDSTFGSCAVTLELLAWTNDTTRATAIAKTSGSNWRYTKSGNTSRMYVGSFRTTTVSGQTEDSVTKRYVWNYYNRVRRPLRKQEATASWAYTTTTIRQANGAAGNQVEVVVGVAEVQINLRLMALALNSAGTSNIAVGIGEDSTTAFATEMLGGGTSTAVLNTYTVIPAALDKTPAVGRHYYAWLEYGAANNTFYGKDQVTTGTQTGLTGGIEG